MTKYVYLFSEGNAKMRDLLGGKGANLAEMSGLGLSVPPGFIISTDACAEYYANDRKLNGDVIRQAHKALKEVEKQSGKKFGDTKNPLLVSVRSGAAVSMPGMMDTILNLGLNDKAVEGLAKATKNPCFAYDSYRRFIQMFADVVMEMEMDEFESRLEAVKKQRGVANDSDLTEAELKDLVARFKALYFAHQGVDFPQDPYEQLAMAIEAVFRSWDNPRANAYRQMNDIPFSLGTAVTVQSMVFGNMGSDCATGVAFSRSPSDGENIIFGEYLVNAQGEDVVAGIRTPEPIEKMKEIMPAAFDELVETARNLEAHYKDMQDMEFTIESGKLYMLQTRSGKRTTSAAINIAIDMVNEKMIDRKRALLMVEARQLGSLLHPAFDASYLAKTAPIAMGLPASPGAATGQVYFDSNNATAAAEAGKDVILVRNETSPEDIEGMHLSKGILTARGGMTSHAAVVARGMGRCCITGCDDIYIDYEKQCFHTDEGREYCQGDWISIDGSTGKVYGEKLPTVEAEISGNFSTIMQWADEYRKMGIRTNADTPENARKAKEFGAEGIGLCRTEHMFFDEKRILAVRKMIISESERDMKAALDELLPVQKGDFKLLFQEMGELPVTIRLLDPPLHEFVPHGDEEIEKLSKQMNVDFAVLKERIRSLAEINPMLGHRGCRLAISFPEIARMQTRAIISAAIEVAKERNITIVPEIMVPLVSDIKELEFVKNVISNAAKQVMDEMNFQLEYHVGTMVEIPRACLLANEIAQEAEFFSFGTNDLSQLTFGFSRDDSGKFLSDYYQLKIFESDPFARIDVEGVGQLMRLAVERGKQTRPDIHLGICGEHGGDPYSIAFCNELGLDYVSCSPFRVPVAKLAAAQAAILQEKE